MGTLKVKEIKKLEVTALRSLCIKKAWYTNGTIEEYNNLFSKLDNVEYYEDLECVTPELLVDIATDIFNHSNLESELASYGVSDQEYILNMLYEINKVCTTYFAVI